MKWRKLRAIVVDEALTVIQWVESQDKKTEPFREWLFRIGELRSLCSSAQMVALTATAGPSNRRKKLNQLSFSSNAEIVVESPDRLNIKYHLNVFLIITNSRMCFHG